LGGRYIDLCSYFGGYQPTKTTGKTTLWEAGGIKLLNMEIERYILGLILHRIHSHHQVLYMSYLANPLSVGKINVAGNGPSNLYLMTQFYPLDISAYGY